MISSNTKGNKYHDELGRFASAAQDAVTNEDKESRKEQTLSNLSRYDFHDKTKWSEKNVRYYIDENLNMPSVMRHSDKIKKVLNKQNLIENNNDELDKMGVDLFAFDRADFDRINTVSDIYNNKDYIDVKTTYADGIQLPFINVEPKQGVWNMHKGLLINQDDNFEFGKTKINNVLLLNFLTQYDKMDNRDKASLIQKYGADKFLNDYIDGQDLYLVEKDKLFKDIFSVIPADSLNKIYDNFLSKFDEQGNCLINFDDFMSRFASFKQKDKGDYIEVSMPLKNGLSIMGKIYPNKPFFDMHMNIKASKDFVSQKYRDKKILTSL